MQTTFFRVYWHITYEADTNLAKLQLLFSLQIKQFPDNSPKTQLVVDLKDTDPDDVFSSVPYEKGSCFLNYLERILGGPG